ncbi:MAG: hypothetical protein G01um101416_941 [Microgenomates group bacterium Gr01-1014_16]|nr:MAG: hypothetical protein G01um101416_941 [Microgenomates group bacterium Gr01-1014_16]
MQTQDLFYHCRNRGKLCDEGEGAVFVDGDDSGDDIAFLVFGFVVVLLDKIQMFNNTYIFLTCKKSNSTGVSRPKMETRTRSLPCSSSIDSTLPKKSLNGPSVILTASLTE